MGAWKSPVEVSSDSHRSPVRISWRHPGSPMGLPRKCFDSMQRPWKPHERLGVPMRSWKSHGTPIHGDPIEASWKFHRNSVRLPRKLDGSLRVPRIPKGTKRLS